MRYTPVEFSSAAAQRDSSNSSGGGGSKTHRRRLPNRSDRIARYLLETANPPPPPPPEGHYCWATSGTMAASVGPPFAGGGLRRGDAEQGATDKPSSWDYCNFL